MFFFLLTKLGMKCEGACRMKLTSPAAVLSYPSSKNAADMASLSPNEQLSTPNTHGGPHASSQLKRSSAGGLTDMSIFSLDASAGQESLTVSEAPGTTARPSQQQMPVQRKGSLQGDVLPAVLATTEAALSDHAAAVRARAHRSCNGAL